MQDRIDSLTDQLQWSLKNEEKYKAELSRVLEERNRYKAALEAIVAKGKASPGDKKDEIAKAALDGV